MNLLATVVVCCVVLCSGCVQQLVDIDHPVIDFDKELAGLVPLDSTQGAIISGMYRPERTGWGGWKGAYSHDGVMMADSVVIVWSDGELKLLGEVNSLLCSLRGGVLNDTVFLVGTWRFTRDSKAGVMRAKIFPYEGGADIANRQEPTKELAIYVDAKGTSGGSDYNPYIVKFGPVRQRSRAFWNIGHRGGGRNTDRLGASENTVEMIRLAPRLGCNAVEIDVVRTKDDVPIVFHDERFTPRTVQGAYLLGRVDNFTHQQIRSTATLVYGERIPTLEEVLDEVIVQRKLGLVWIDVKQPLVVDAVVRTTLEAKRRARAAGRDNLRLMIGLPDQAVYDAFRSHPLRDSVEAICELSVEHTREINAAAWAPRWTAGLQTNFVQAMQSEGRLCFTWTLDDPRFMNEFLENGDFDGFLTNLPAVLAAKSLTRTRRQP
jgi:glycerophosphoryl diester phosphodiesterase